MVTLDMTIVTVALPGVQGDMGTRAHTTEWVALGYMLALVALALPAGRWLDLVGKRPALVFAVSGFAATRGSSSGWRWRSSGWPPL